MNDRRRFRTRAASARTFALRTMLLPGAVALAACGGGGDDGTAPTTGRLQLTVDGLVDGALAAVEVSGPGGYGARVATASATLEGLAPGSYRVTAATVATPDALYAAQPAAQSVTVGTATNASATARLRYAATTGLLWTTVTGLPAGAVPVVTVTGPAGYARTLGAADTLRRLAPGTYAVAASSVVADGRTWVPEPASAALQLFAGTRATQAIRYRDAATATLNLVIEGLQVTQGVQTFDNLVPLVQDRSALLRVFVRANESSSARPAVRVRFWQGATLVETLTMASDAVLVPNGSAEGSLATSWNAVLPAGLLRPGLSVVADVDPTGVVAESNEGDNAWPTTSGERLALDVRPVPPLDVRFVPVRNGATGTTGNVSTANVDQLLSTTRRMFPVAAVTASVRDVYTTSGTVQADDSSWSRVLREVAALRTAEGSQALYYGVVKVGYTSGIAGLGYVGFPVSLGWDYPGSGPAVMTHELGHNFGRRHAPCGGAAGTDASYPGAGGVTGDWGWDAGDGTLKSPTLTDVMGYCGSKWVSAYTYGGVLSFRTTSAGWGGSSSGGSGGAVIADAAALSSSVADAARPCVLVWGRVRDGRVTLEPAFQLVTRPSLPATGGAHVVRGVDASGATLFTVAFDGTPVADSPDGERHFAFAVPLDEAAAERFTELRVANVRGGGAVERIARMLGVSGRPTTDASATVRRAAGGRVAVRWDAARHPMVMVRDARTGRVLSFARGGATDVATGAADVDLVFSDRVRSAVRRVRVADR